MSAPEGWQDSAVDGGLLCIADVRCIDPLESFTKAGAPMLCLALAAHPVTDDGWGDEHVIQSLDMSTDQARAIAAYLLRAAAVADRRYADMTTGQN